MADIFTRWTQAMRLTFGNLNKPLAELETAINANSTQIAQVRSDLTTTNQLLSNKVDTDMRFGKLFFYKNSEENQAYVCSNYDGHVIIRTGLSTATQHIFSFDRDGYMHVDGKLKFHDHVAALAVNVDAATKTGDFYALSGTLPSGVIDGALKVTSLSDDYVTQQLHDWRTNKIFIRSKALGVNGGTWLAWKEI